MQTTVVRTYKQLLPFDYNSTTRTKQKCCLQCASFCSLKVVLWLDRKCKVKKKAIEEIKPSPNLNQQNSAIPYIPKIYISEVNVPIGNNIITNEHNQLLNGQI